MEPSDDISKKLADEIIARRKNCTHEMQRFGPSYTARQDGSYKVFDESICMKCGYTSSDTENTK